MLRSRSCTSKLYTESVTVSSIRSELNKTNISYIQNSFSAPKFTCRWCQPNVQYNKIQDIQQEISLFFQAIFNAFFCETNLLCRKNTKIWVPVALDNKMKFLARTSSQRSLSSNNNSGGKGGCAGIDADFNNWMVEYDLFSSFLRCSIYFQDVNKIPRNHLRLV